MQGRPLIAYLPLGGPVIVRVFRSRFSGTGTDVEFSGHLLRELAVGRLAWNQDSPAIIDNSPAREAVELVPLNMIRCRRPCLFDRAERGH